MIVFVSGPMAGYKDHNFPAFDAAALKLRQHGFVVVSPADLDRFYGVHEHTPVTDDMVKQLLLSDLKALAYCDAVLLLPGSDHSRGSAAEIAFARCFDIPTFTSMCDLLTFRKEKA